MEKTRRKARNSARSAPPAPVRERVLNAAFSAFVEKGYNATSTLEIASRAKVSKRELYQICADKTGLLRQAIANGLAECACRWKFPRRPIARHWRQPCDRSGLQL